MFCNKIGHIWFPFWWKRNRFCLICGVAEELKVGSNSITLGPGGNDIIRFTGTHAAVQMGDVAMDVGTGRPCIFAESGSRPIAHSNEIVRQKEIILCGELKAVDENIFTNVGASRISTTYLPVITTTVTFSALLTATAGKTAECQLYNMTDGAIVVGSVLSSSSLSPDFQSAVITLASGAKDYLVQLRMTTASGGTDQVTCSSAMLTLTW